MKKVIILAVLIASLAPAKSQVFVSTSFGAGITGKSPAGALSLGLTAGKYILQTGFHTHLSAKNPRVFRLAAGRSFPVGESANINVTGGVANIGLHSENKTIMQPKGTWLASVEYSKAVRQNGEWFVDYTQTGRFNFLTLGLKYFFVGGGAKRGCPSTWNR